MRKRTGKIFKTCLKCHLNYHIIRKDFKAWGKKGGMKTKQKGKLFYWKIKHIGGNNENKSNKRRR